MVEQNCPECGTSPRPRPTLAMRCRKCGHRWQRVLMGGIAFELQISEGEEAQGPFDRSRIREMIYSGVLTGRERVRLPGSDANWTLLTEQAELHEVLELLEIRSARSQRIQGWQSQAAEAPTRPAAAPPVPAPRTPERPTVRPILLMMGFAVLLIAALYILMLQW